MTKHCAALQREGETKTGQGGGRGRGGTETRLKRRKTIKTRKGKRSSRSKHDKALRGFTQGNKSGGNGRFGEKGEQRQRQRQGRGETECKILDTDENCIYLQNGGKAKIRGVQGGKREGTEKTAKVGIKERCLKKVKWCKTGKD